MTSLSALAGRYDRFLLGLDGCVWVGDEPTPRATDAITALRAAGNGVAAVGPQYQFWAGLNDGWVVRGGFGFDCEHEFCCGGKRVSLAAMYRFSSVGIVLLLFLVINGVSNDIGRLGG